MKRAQRTPEIGIKKIIQIVFLVGIELLALSRCKKQPDDLLNYWAIREARLFSECI